MLRPRAPQIYPVGRGRPEVGRLAQASWYTRVEYFHWNERIAGQDFVNEGGALFTLGYSRQIGIERYRAECSAATCITTVMASSTDESG